MSAIGWKAIAGIAGGVVLAGSALGAIGLQLPQIATKAEIRDLRKYVAQVDLSTTQQALESSELRTLRLEQEAKDREQQGENTETIQREIQILKRRTRGLDQRVQELLKGDKD